ncbi:MAG: glycogen debranching protein [Chloroflexi bacterium]|nr:glycogen debranching protein [Chloroflexota bacterium]
MALDRGLCSTPEVTEAREWLVTNGIGGYASGTVAGTLTRSYHGLLIATMKPPLGRTLLVSQLAATAIFDGQHYDLSRQQQGPDQTTGAGLAYLEHFRLEGTTPVWTYLCGDALLEKRIWMQPGANTTYVHYNLRRARQTLKLESAVLVNCRNHHARTTVNGIDFRTRLLPNGVEILPAGTSVETPFYVYAQNVTIVPRTIWHADFYLTQEAYRGEDEYDANLEIAIVSATLEAGDALSVIVTTQPDPELDGERAYWQRVAYEKRLLAPRHIKAAPPSIQQLALAADQFIVTRSTPEIADGKTIIAGYPWFADWGRDTMISLPGLTLVTERFAIARQLLQTFAGLINRGMLPNTFPEDGEAPEYNTVDATLWFFEAVRAYLTVTGDHQLIKELLPALHDIITWHWQGTRYGIRVDPQDGLLFAGEPGVQLTWMDVKIENEVITPRTGKPVEVNALWLNALHVMIILSSALGKDVSAYRQLAETATRSFNRFWNSRRGYCYDVLDSPAGDDPTLRPNQLIAAALPYTPFSTVQLRQIVDICARRLVTSYGLRSLAPDAPGYTRHYGGPREERDRAYHQGTVWMWLIGPFVQAHLRAYNDPKATHSYLQPVIDELHTHGLGTLSEIADGGPPFTPRGCIAQAWSVAEVLRAWHLVNLHGIRDSISLS